VKYLYPMSDYIHQNIIEGFDNKNNGFNYVKLLRLLGELNDNHARKNHYSSAMLIRGILDHIPPLLGYTTFDEVANNYPWSQTDKKYMKALLDFKNEGDDALHTVISNEQDFLAMDTLPSSNRINTLLQECLTKGIPFQNQATTKNPATQSSGIVITLGENNIAWANWGASRYRYSAFQVKLAIDNFKSNNPDYIKASIRVKTSDGMWGANHFLFVTGRSENPVDPDEEIRIEPKVVKKVAVLISDYLVVGTEFTKPMPDIDRDTMEIVVETKSGKTFTLPIKPSWITKQ